jgi:trigger factor
MPVKVEDAGVCKKKLTFEIPQEAIQKKLDKTLDELVKSAQIPGFRPGHAPRRLVQKRLADDIGEQVKTELIAEAYEKAVEEEKLDVLREEDFDPETVEMPTEGPMTFEVEIEVKPEIEPPDTSKIEIDVPKIEVRDEDVEAAINNLRRSRGRFVEQKKTAKIEERDMLTADVKVVVGDEVLADQADGNVAVFPQALGGIHVDAIVKELSGKKAGDTVEFAVAVPETHENEALRGQEATITITVKSVRRIDMPEFDDEFAKSVGMESAADVEKAVRERLEGDMVESRETARRDAVAAWLLEKVPLEVPEGVAEANAGRVFNQQVVSLQRQGVPTDYLQEHADELLESCRGRAQRDLKLSFIVEALAKKENFEATEDEVQARVSLLAQNYNRPVDRMYEDLEKRGHLDALREQVLTDKIYAMLLSKAEITEVEPPKPEPEAAEEKPEEKKSKSAKKMPAKKPTTKKTAGDEDKAPGRKAPKAARKTAKKAAKKADDKTE